MAAHLHVGHWSLTPSQRCRQAVWKKWLQGVTMRAPAWGDVQHAHADHAFHTCRAAGWPRHIGNGCGLRHLAVNGASEAQGAGAAIWVTITAAEPQLLLWVHGASLKAAASAAEKRQQQPSADAFGQQHQPAQDRS